jgi:CheY-like chemotaxis protein
VFIEDNLSNVRLLEYVLAQRPGVTLMPAMQGSIGLDLARQHQPDLVLLDLNLPDLDGRDVLQSLKTSPDTCSIPVVVLSAEAVPSRIEEMRAAGADGYLTKPLDVKEFLKILDTILAKERGKS